MFQCIERDKGKLQQADGMSGHGVGVLKGIGIWLAECPAIVRAYNEGTY